MKIDFAWFEMALVWLNVSIMFAMQVSDALTTYIGIKLGLGKEGNSRLLHIQAQFARVSHARWLWLVGPKAVVLVVSFIGAATLMMMPSGPWHWLTLGLTLLANVIYFDQIRENLRVIVRVR
jgi:hypothetical protein